MIGRAGLALLLAICLSNEVFGQQPDQDVPVIDTIIVVVDNVFSDEEAQSSLLSRSMNRFRFPTRHYVVRAQLLFKTGEPYDSARVSGGVK